MIVGSSLRTLLLATFLTLPLFILKQYVHGLEILFWILMWRHYWPQEPLDQSTTPQTLPSKEEFLKNLSEPCLQQQRENDDEEKLAQLSERESNLVVDATAQKHQSEQYCSSCSSKTGVVLCCQHTFCKACLVERNNQGKCPACQSPLWDRNRLPIGKMHRWSYKAILISSLIILGIFMIKSFLCWFVLPSKSAGVSSQFSCSMDLTNVSFGIWISPPMILVALTRIYSEQRTSGWYTWSRDTEISPFVASQMAAHALRMSDDLTQVLDVVVRG